jgi:hypothetical protein
MAARTPRSARSDGRRLDLLDRAAHADGIDLRRSGERPDGDRNVIAPAGRIRNVREQERAALAFREPALELPPHQRMQLGVLVDRAVDPHEQSLRFERGEVRLEIKRRAGRRSCGSTRIGAHVEHLQTPAADDFRHHFGTG